MGLIGGNGSDQNDSSSSWGRESTRDPVHPLDNAYATIARKLLEEINKEVVTGDELEAAAGPAGCR